MAMDPLNYTLSHTFPGYYEYAEKLAREIYDMELLQWESYGSKRDQIESQGYRPEPWDQSRKSRIEIQLRLLCNLSRNESYDHGYRILQHNLGLTAEQMLWPVIFKSCKIKKPASGTCVRAEAMKMCLQASLAIAAERGAACQHTFRDSQTADNRVVPLPKQVPWLWVFVFCIGLVIGQVVRLYWMLSHQ